MATKTKKEETKGVENMKEELEDDIQAQEPDNQTDDGSGNDNSDDGKKEPETKESFGTKAKNLGGKVLKGVKMALPYVGAFAAGAGAAVGALVVMSRPDGTELEMLPQDDSMVPVDDFIDGEAEIVGESTDTAE